MEEILMNSKTNVTVVPELEVPKGNSRARFIAYAQCMRKQELKAKNNQETVAKNGGNQ